MIPQQSDTDMNMAPPPTPADISVFFEEGRYVFRLDTHSLYTYDLDKPDLPTCTEQCAQRWPAVIASANATDVGDWTLIERPDHSKQWCYRHRPVYTYADDAPGQANGDGVDGLWHVVKP